MGVFLIFKIAQMVPNCTTHHNYVLFVMILILLWFFRNFIVQAFCEIFTNILQQYFVFSLIRL